jgi:uncharacterized DUF497 family protein
MAGLRIEWDPRKAAANERNHGVSFVEAATAFYDENGRITPDPDHSDAEDRFVLMGLSWSLRLLVVCHCHREASGVIRILSLAELAAASAASTERSSMRKDYDFSKSKKNPYAARLKRQVTIRLDESTVAYFRELAEETGIPYQTLINLYLRDCAAKNRRLDLSWRPTP